MKQTFLSLGFALFCFSASSNLCFAQEFNDVQKQEIEQIASDYLAEHPEVVVAALQKLQEQQAKAHDELVVNIGEFYRKDKSTPMIGNEQSKHYIIDFFDYNCGYCKTMEPAINSLINDKNLSLQVVYVNLPIIAKTSSVSATVAQAIYNLDPKKFVVFHDKLMRNEADCNDIDALKDLAKSIGLNWDKVVSEMESRRPQEKLTGDLAKVRDLGLSGVPYLIINGREVRGAISNPEDLRKILEQK